MKKYKKVTFTIAIYRLIYNLNLLYL